MYRARQPQTKTLADRVEHNLSGDCLWYEGASFGVPMFAGLLALALATPRLGDAVQPTAQAVSVVLDPALDRFTGVATIELTIAESVDGFNLYGEELEITRATLTRGRKTRPVTVTSVEDVQLRVQPDRRLMPGAYTLEIAYTAPIHTQPYGVSRFLRSPICGLATSSPWCGGTIFV